MIRYVKYQNQNQSSPAYGKWYLRAVIDETVDIEGLAEHMAKHNSTFSKGTITGILMDGVACMKELMLEGKAVKMQDLAIFKLGLVCNGAATRDEAKASNVTGFRFNAKSTGGMSVTSLKQEVQLKELRNYNGTADTDEQDDPDGNGGSGANNGDQQSQEPVKYRITFKFHDGTEDDHEYEAGETINYPTASSGYKWPDSKPSVMPAQAVTVTEVSTGGGGGGNYGGDGV